MSSSLSPLSLSLPLPGRLLPPLGATGSAQLSSSSSSLIISSRTSELTARKSPGLYYRQLGGSISALRSSLPYQEKHSLAQWIIPEVVTSNLERSTWSPKAPGLSHLQLFIWSRVLSNICPIYVRKASFHSRKGELLVLLCGHIRWNCENRRVVTRSRKIIS